MKKKINSILLIDDDEPTNFLSQMIIEGAACTESIEIATSGEQAIKYLTNTNDLNNESSEYPQPDLIFLDINMPAMNGWEFLERYNVLEKQHKGNVVIIMLTTSLNPDDKLRSEEFPYVSGFENKPLTNEKLELILRRHFPQNC